MRTIQIHPLSLAVGAIAVTAAFLLTAQTTPPAQTTWPPPKAMIVNVFEYPATPVSIPVGGQHTVLTVPTDRWLTITGAGFGGSGNFLWAEIDTSGGIHHKGIAANTSDFLFSPGRGGGPVGWTFAPGSTVSLTNFDPPTAPSPQLALWSVIGYYSRN